MVGEGVLERRVQGALLARTKRGELEAGGPLGRGRRAIEVDHHPVRAAQVTVAARLEELDGGGVGADDTHAQRLYAVRAGELLRPPEEQRADSAAGVLRMDEVQGGVDGAVLHHRAVARDRAGGGLDDSVAAVHEPAPPVEHILLAPPLRVVTTAASQAWTSSATTAASSGLAARCV